MSGWRNWPLFRIWRRLGLDKESREALTLTRDDLLALWEQEQGHPRSYNATHTRFAVSECHFHEDDAL